MGYLISGHLGMTVGNQSYKVNPGDTISLEKDLPGKWSNTAEQDAELLWKKLTDLRPQIK